MTDDGPYRKAQETVTTVREKVVYTINVMQTKTALILIAAQVVLLAGAVAIASVITAPKVTKVVVTQPKPHETLTPAQHEHLRQQDVALCDRVCDHNFVAVRSCHWLAGGVRSCACACGPGTNDTSDSEEQR